MIDYETYCRLKALQQDPGLTAAQIAGVLELHRHTVAKWLARERYQRRKPHRRASKLDPYSREIRCWLEHHPLSARQVFQRLGELGYEGGYSIVKDYVRTLRPRHPAAYLRLAFGPGECAQVDWGNYGTLAVGSTRRRLSFFVMVLCYSRMTYLEFTLGQSMEQFLSAHENALRSFDGVVSRVMVDHLKSAVLEHRRGEAPRFNPRYLDFAQHWGFAVRACAPRRGNEKGRVENAVGYVKKNFLNGLELGDLTSLNLAARQWLDRVANVRIHGHTHRRPVDLWQEERRHLQPLPDTHLETARVLTVRASSQFRVAFEANHYSVPATYAGARLLLKAYPDRLCVYAGERLIARHRRCYDRHQDIEDPEHARALLAQRRNAREQRLLGRFLGLCAEAERYYAELSERRLDAAGHVRKILALAEHYDPDSLRRAIQDAIAFEAFSAEYIANLLAARERLQPEASALHVPRAGDLLELEVAEPDLTLYERGPDR